MTQTTAMHPEVLFDKQEQLQRVQPYMIHSETLRFVFDCLSSDIEFVDMTDQRLIFYNALFFGNKRAMVSIPLNQVVGVASEDNGTLMPTNEITVLTKVGPYSFVFSKPERAKMLYFALMDQILNQAYP